MHLIVPLVSGVTGAEGGVAQVYTRDGSGYEPYYYDYNGAVRVSSGSDVQLDALGAATIYVNGIAKVVVLNQAGATVRTFVSGNSASSTELITPSFPGADYVTGVTGISQPSTVKAALDTWVSSGGVPDFGINNLGTTISVQSLTEGIFSAVRGGIAVKAFGAVGDGVADDSVAIGKAVAFAATIGGTVLFYPGTYLISSTIVVPGTVQLIGSSPASTTIVQNSSAARLLTVQSSTAQVYVAGLTFRYSASTSDYSTFGINILAGSKARFLYCAFGSASVPMRRVIACASDGGLDSMTELDVDSCSIFAVDKAFVDFRRDRPLSLPTFRRCTFAMTSAVSGTIYADTPYGNFDCCSFTGAAPDSAYIGASSSTVNTGATNATKLAVDACLVVGRSQFSNPTSGSCNALVLDVLDVGASILFIDKCAFGGNVTPNGLMPHQARMGHGESRVQRVTSNVDVAINNQSAFTTILTRTSTVSTTAYLSIAPEGTGGRLFIANASGGTIAAQKVSHADSTVATGDFPVGSAGVAMNNGTWRLYEWVMWPLSTQTLTTLNLPNYTERHFAVLADGVQVGSPA